jgi:Fe2+ transport system protein B
MEEPDASYRELLKIALRSGVKKGWQGFLWMIKIVIPVFFLTTLLAWTGWLHYLNFIIKPFMSVLHLPAVAALPLIIGMLTGIYGGIAAMVVLPFSPGEMTIMAIFLLMAHNMIQEGIVQGQSGIHPLKATVFRIVMAFLTAAIVAPWLVDASSTAGITHSVAQAVQPPLYDVFLNWVDKTFWLVLKILIIIMTLLTILEMIKTFNWIVPIVRFFSPILKLMGLDQKAGFLWMTAIFFGLTYGGAVIVEEAREHHLSDKDLEMLHLSIGINHSMVEDPPLFIVLGLSPFWLYIPRLLAAIISIHLIHLWQSVTAKVFKK